MRQPEDAVAEIDQALAAIRRQGLTNIRVELSWPHYGDLLKLKGLDFSATAVKRWGSAYEGRPLKVYRGHPLKFIQHGSQIIGTNEEGHLLAELVAYRD